MMLVTNNEYGMIAMLIKCSLDSDDDRGDGGKNDEGKV